MMQTGIYILAGFNVVMFFVGVVWAITKLCSKTKINNGNAKFQPLLNPDIKPFDANKKPSKSILRSCSSTTTRSLKSDISESTDYEPLKHNKAKLVFQTDVDIPELGLGSSLQNAASSSKPVKKTSFKEPLVLGSMGAPNELPIELFDH